MKRKILKIMLYLCGFFCIAYPIYSKFLSFKSQTEIITNYNQEIEAMDKEILENKQKKAEEYNIENSSEVKVINPNDIEPTEEQSNYSFLDLGELIGVINIPKISLELPIYEGVTSNNLLKGVAHMENTSLPNGNLSTHAILAGHTGISQAEIFDNLNELNLDDEFYIIFLGEMTKYKVIDKRVVLPDETSSLKIEDNRCLVTLVTCTPKTVNTHRLLVTGEKVEDTDNTIQVVEDNNLLDNEKNLKDNDFVLFLEFIKKNKSMAIFIIIIIVLLILLTIVPKLRKRKKEK